MTDASGNTNYSYDTMDRLTQKATPEGTLSYTYDAAGHVASIASSNMNGASMAYTYDSLNRLSTVVDSRLGTTTYAYDPANNVTTATYPNGFQSIYTYDELNRVTAQASQVSGYTYQLGPTGNRTSASEYSGRQVTWSYDGIYRLTNEAITGAAGGKNGTVAYGLDPVGNRESENSSLSGVPSGSFGYNADDEVSTESYDQNGNTLATGGKTFAYNSQNQLVSMGSTVALVYDGDGNRVSKTVSGTGTTRYLVDDLNPTGYPQIVDELTSAAVTRTYTYGLQRISQDQVISNTWTPSFYGYDGGGNVRQLTNSARTVTDTYEYDAYGNHWTVSGSTPNNMLYTGEEWDPDLGLLYLRARYMNPLTGRFLSRDPDDGVPTDPISLHKYLYANDDPVDLSDPGGLAAAPVPVPEPPPAPQQPKTAGLEYLIIVGTISLTAQHALPPLRNQINCMFEAEGGGLRAVSQYLGAPQDLLVDWASCSAISGSKKGRGHSDPIQGPLPEPNPGPNPNQPNGCNKCPPDSPYWEQKGAPGAHGCKSGIHYHWYHYNQSPDCSCHPSREDSCTKPDPPAQPWTPGTVWP